MRDGGGHAHPLSSVFLSIGPSSQLCREEDTHLRVSPARQRFVGVLRTCVAAPPPRVPPPEGHGLPLSAKGVTVLVILTCWEVRVCDGEQVGGCSALGLGRGAPGSAEGG